MSADTGTEKWGRRFFPDSSVNPVIERSKTNPYIATTSFRSKIKSDDPVYPDVMAGALDFDLQYGEALGMRMIMWSGMYRGKGGKFGDKIMPASDCDNFWLVQK